LFALWKAIGEVSDDPGIGLQLGAEPRFERFDPPQIAAACSRNFRDALNRIARCKILTCPEEIRVQSQGDEATVVFAFLKEENAEPDALVDICLSWTLAIGRRGTDGQIKPLRVELIRDPKNEELLQRHYDCPIQFRSLRNAIVFRAADLDLPFITCNEELVKILDHQVESVLQAHLTAQSVSAQVRQALRHSIAGNRPSREEVAKHLHLSLRTLQRRLQEAGVTFQELVQETRSTLARQYLTDQKLELSEVAFLVGYEDPNSFIRAFLDWDGTSPGAWRNRHHQQFNS
jgi:AraC-like DNA-binding protein